MISASPSHTSIASLTQEISVLTAAKQQWEAQTSDALEPIQALQDYASVLRTTLSQVDDTVQALRQEYMHRMKELFDEPMMKLRREIKAMRDEYERILREDIVPTTDVNNSKRVCVVHKRVPPLCVLFETYAAVNGERMRTPPDVMEGIIPMVGRQKSGVFHREISSAEFRAKKTEFRRLYGERVSDYLPYVDGAFISNIDLSEILRQHNWCVIALQPLRGIAHFYDDAGDERAFFFSRDERNRLTVLTDPAHMSSISSILRAVWSDIERRESAARVNPFGAPIPIPNVSSSNTSGANPFGATTPTFGAPTPTANSSNTSGANPFGAPTPTFGAPTASSSNTFGANPLYLRSSRH